ncbi:histidine--tRNA ligase [Pedobacter punctiformis]|uniref:histidine--tRNA ligase n=1 Tax=Pedobacter punctiformis TaxID=3004097 RepID=UPI003D174C21
MSSSLFHTKIKRTNYFFEIKNIFVKYLLSKGTKSLKFKPFINRLAYYSEISDRNFRYEEIYLGFYYIINRSSTLKKILDEEVKARKSISAKELTPSLSKKALRYDLTVPFARYVVMHQNDITLPFKRFQVQPVWRADRPQKGRYREFYQCDVDVVGSESLLNEAEFILIYDEALSKLGLKDFVVKINNRKILSGIAEIIGKPDLIIDMTVAIDKLDKIGLDGVCKELLERGFTEADLEKLRPVILLQGTNEEKLASLKAVLANSETGLKGIAEIEQVFEYVDSLIAYALPLTAKLELDITLARGLNYYTGCIFEVKTNEVAMGSIGGGGRYDDLTGMFGLKDLTGVGVSFGADRIYDVLEELNLFPSSAEIGTKVLISNFDAEAEKYALPILQQLRTAGIPAELYPTAAKLKKQMAYADAKKIPYVILIGGDEIASGELTLKDMQSGEQKKLTTLSILDLLK